MLARNIVVTSFAFAALSALIASACTNATCTELHQKCDDTSSGGHAGAGGLDGVAGSTAGSNGGGEQGGMSVGGSAGSGTAGNGGSGEAGAAGAAACGEACNGLTPVCDVASNTCVQCSKSTDCEDQAMPVCDTGTNACVECAKSGDCKDAAKPACDADTDTCVECLGSGDCKDAAKPLCDQASAQCVSCLKQSDCTSATASACNAGVCTACTTDAECSNIPGKGVCDAGTCVQCTGKKFAACGQSAGTPLVCDSLKRTCTTSKQQSAGLCLTCVTDAQCKAGQICVLDKFGNPAQDVGYFCHWKKGDTANGAPASCSMTGKPYSATQLAVVSVDGNTSDICTLRTSTCIANNQFGAKDCAVASTPSDVACGFAPGEDSKCTLFDVGSYRCTMTCLVPEDCPGTTCDTGATPRVCTFN